MNQVMPAGTNVPVLEFRQSSDPAVFTALRRAILSPDLRLTVCYCSIFDECWKNDLATLSLTPPQVDACEQPAVPFDQGFVNTER